MSESGKEGRDEFGDEMKAEFKAAQDAESSSTTGVTPTARSGEQPGAVSSNLHHGGNAIEDQEHHKPIVDWSSWSNLDWARFYVFVKLYSVIPLEPGGIDPLISWEEYQKRRPTDAELVEWFGNTDNNIGIVTGKISGIAVIELNSMEAKQYAETNDLFSYVIVQAGMDFHLYYPYEDEFRTLPISDDFPSINFCTEGDYVVAPPSVHYSRVEYGWVLL